MDAATFIGIVLGFIGGSLATQGVISRIAALLVVGIFLIVLGCIAFWWLPAIS
jgi:lipopolysaccharide export LptBFGC system permease protein LptF